MVGWLRQALDCPRRVRRPVDRHGIDELDDRPRRRPRGGRDRGCRTGLGGRSDAPRLQVYASAEAHSSIEKACMILGLGRASCVAIPTDAEFRLRPDALAAAIAADRAAGHQPIAIVATVGTTSSTSVDRSPRWHRLPSRRASGSVSTRPTGARPRSSRGARALRRLRQADSIVVNPHKWLFTPLDASLFLCRRLELARAAFSLSPVPAHARSSISGPRLQRVPAPARAPLPGAEAVGPAALVRGRRTPASCRRHIELGHAFAAWVDADPEWERMAPVPFSTVCFRHRPPALAGDEGARRPQRGRHRSREPDRRGVPVAHPAERPVRDPAVRRQPADRGTARGAGLGAAAAATEVER